MADIQRQVSAITVCLSTYRIRHKNAQARNTQGIAGAVPDPTIDLDDAVVYLRLLPLVLPLGFLSRHGSSTRGRGLVPGTALLSKRDASVTRDRGDCLPAGFLGIIFSLRLSLEETGGTSNFRLGDC